MGEVTSALASQETGDRAFCTIRFSSFTELSDDNEYGVIMLSSLLYLLFLCWARAPLPRRAKNWRGIFVPTYTVNWFLCSIDLCLQFVNSNELWPQRGRPRGTEASIRLRMCCAGRTRRHLSILSRGRVNRRNRPDKQRERVLKTMVSRDTDEDHAHSVE